MAGPNRIGATDSFHDELYDELIYELQLSELESSEPPLQNEEFPPFTRRFVKEFPIQQHSSDRHRQQKKVSRFRRTDNDDASSSKGEQTVIQIECKICMESRPHDLFICTTQCDHDLCIYCCKRHAESQVSTRHAQILCPFPDCGHSFDYYQCRELLSEHSLEILRERQTEEAIPRSKKIYCPFPECSALMEKSDGIGRNPQDRFVECGSCHRGFCVKCRVPWHAEKTCVQYRVDALNEAKDGDRKLKDLAKRKKWQLCKKCCQYVELVNGCNHMTCVCGHEFCYSCGATYQKKEPTCECKFFNEEHILAPRRQRPREPRE